MAKILYFTNVIRRIGMMQQSLDRLQAQGALEGSCACYWLTEATPWEEKWQQELATADFVLMKWMGSGLDTPFLVKFLKALQALNLPYYIDAAGTKEEELIARVDPEAVDAIRNYASFGGEINYYNLWLYLKELCDQEGAKVPSPDPIHWCGIYHPRAKAVYTDLQTYKEVFCQQDRPTIGILFYRDEWVWGDLEYQGAMIEAIEAAGMNAICVFSNGMPDEEMGIPSLRQVFEKFFCQQGVAAIDVLLNVMKFSFAGSGSVNVPFLKEWNVPVLAAYSLIASYEEWKPNLEGMNPMEVSISVTLPEFDGTIHGVPIASKKVLANGDVRYKPIHERIERMVSKAKKWALLRRTENSRKRLAIVFHNYPPRNSNIGSAVGLDTIVSVRNLMALLGERGYQVGTLPEDGEAFIKELTDNATNDVALLTEAQLARAQKLSSREYKSFFRAFEPQVQKQMEADWGPAPGKVMVFEDELLIPGTMYGNIFVTVQPPRGFGEAPEKIYHSPFTAPTHHYLGFYYWLRQVWQAHAVAHIGTHGSLEWLPGKNAGLDCTCYPDLALGDLPNIYPYLITITGEGIQAKRRGAACLIDHLPAPQERAGVYDQLEELESIMDEYAHFAQSAPESLPRLQELVLAKVAEAELTNEVPYTEGEDFGQYVGRLHNYITDLKNMEVHVGLHILGQPPVDKLLTESILQLTRLENGEVPSLNQVVCSTYGLDYYTLLENASTIYEPLGITYSQLIDKVADQCRQLVVTLQEGGFTKEAITKAKGLGWVQQAKAEQQEQLQQLLEFISMTIYPRLEQTRAELTNMLHGLEGGYVEPGPSGSPNSGGVELLPTGRNFYGVDPRLLPTPAAWELGKELGDQAINRFIEEEGRYPESVGIVLWSGSNMRSHGQCIAEFLYLLGVRPLYQRGSQKIIGLEPLALEELKRPRIDVTGRISGLFRDTMPSVANLLDKAVLLVAGLEEDISLNYVRKHVLEESRELEEQGLEAHEAWRQAAYRIFGDQQGVYGAGVAALLEAKNWETIDDIADVYVRWGAHAYGGKTKGRFLPEQFRRRMGSLDLTIKNEDNHDTNMLSSDDYNAYHGGMIAAVRSIKGKAPRSYCGDSTDRSKVTLHSVQEQAKRIFRSESINPKFIEGMMQHGYKGAADLANMLAHSYQWDATSKIMEDWMYEKYAEKYAFEPKVQEWLRRVNPWALQRMTETLLEAQQRGLWQPKESTLAQLQELYLSIEGQLEEGSDE